jgi:hypothetical protein
LHAVLGRLIVSAFGLISNPSTGAAPAELRTPYWRFHRNPLFFYLPNLRMAWNA